MTLEPRHKSYYLFGSRIASHLLFWVCYYVAFSLIWNKGDNLLESFYLEFVLLPLRVAAVYLVLYWLLPTTLLKSKYLEFILKYGVALVIIGVLQNLSIYFFYESNRGGELWEIVSVSQVVRAMILVNSTVMVVGAFKIVTLYNEHVKEEDKEENDPLVEIKSDKRVFRVRTSEIMYIEGMGNYIVYHTKSGKNLICYSSMKQALAQLPAQFRRAHKSFIINDDHVKSYSNDNIEIGDRLIPLGKNVKLSF